MAYLILWGIHLEPRAFPHLWSSDYTAFSPSSSINPPLIPSPSIQTRAAILSGAKWVHQGRSLPYWGHISTQSLVKGQPCKQNLQAELLLPITSKGMKQSFALRMLWLHKNILKIIKILWQLHLRGTTLDHLLCTPWNLDFFSAHGYPRTSVDRGLTPFRPPCAAYRC